MSFLNGNNFVDRQAAAAAARKAMAEKFLSRPKYDPTDPAVLAREEKRREILAAREIREIERRKREAELAAQQVANKAAEDLARQEQVRLHALSREADEQRSREDLDRVEFERKLDRDARYAARKERKKKKVSPMDRYR